MAGSTVVILGGAYGGLHTAHYLLKHNKDVQVVLVSQNSHFFWNLASVRAIVPGTLDDSKLYIGLAEALARYGSRASVVVGSAHKVDTAANSVVVKVPGEVEGETTERVLKYDHLVVATGARCTVPASDGEYPATPIAPWKADGTFEEYQALLAETQAKVAAARHIVVAGAGSTGIEAAAELGHAFGGKSSDVVKRIVLLASGDSILPGEPSVGASALSELKKLHVEVLTNSKVVNAQRLASGRVGLKIDGVEAPLMTDLYFAATGLTPNSEMLDASLLNEHKYVEVDEFYRVSGVAAHNVWAVGDVVSKPRAGFMITQKQAAGVGKNIDLVLAGKAPLPVKLLPMDILAVAIGPNRGAGRAGFLPLPSLAVHFAKGRTLGTQMLPSYLDGSIA